VTSLYFYDDATARALEPFALTRPAAELRVGAWLVRERWASLLGGEAAASVCAPHLARFEEPGAAPVTTESIPAGAWLVNARCAPALGGAAQGADRGAGVLRVQGRVAAVRLARALPPPELRDGTLSLESLATAARGAELDGFWVDAAWDLVVAIGALLAADIEAVATQRETAAMEPDRCAVLGGSADRAVYVEGGAVVEPFVTFDLSSGSVYLERGATLQSFTRIAGPCWIGRDSVVGSDRVASVVVGDTCKVHGEVSNTVFLGHCNKGHDGFVGHSYLGRWVNLGANTVTSNLKNTYGTVELWTPAGIRGSGQQFLGTLFGDHAKTGIGLTLTTGTVLGAGAQVYGSQMPPKVVPPFAWGDEPPYDVYRLDKFLEVAERVMGRRHVELTEGARAQLSAAHAARWSADS